MDIYIERGMCEVLKVLKTNDSPSISAIRHCLFSGCLRSSHQEFLSAHLPLSKSGLNPVQVPPGPPSWSLESPLLCFTRSTDKTCATDPSPILYTSATRSFIGSPFSGCNVTGASYLDKDHNLCAQSKKLSLFPSQRQISHSMHPQTRTIKVCICIFLV